VWRNAIPVRFGIIDGRTSWSRTGGAIEIGTYHADGSRSHLLTTVAHEFGHQVAFTYGTWEYLGAAPAGWPYAGPEAAEAWADCVALAFTGIVDPSHGLAPCPADSLQWTAAWLASGPPA
jgi:hypothetical protein